MPFDIVRRTFLCSVAQMNSRTERAQPEEEIPAYEAKLRKLAAELSRVEDRERRRLAVTLHDRVGQTLALAQIKLESMRSLKLSPELAEGIVHVMELVEQSISHTRSLTAELSPPILYEVGLAAAIQWWAEQLQRRHGIITTLRGDSCPEPRNEEIRMLMFQAARELLMNVVKHARVETVDVVMLRDDGILRVEVVDRGVGFDGNILTSSKGFGLFSLRERLTNMGGGLSIESSPGHGTRAIVSVPVDRTPSIG